MNLGGRPPIFATPEAMQERINAYFVHIRGEKSTEEGKEDLFIRAPEVPTITGLCLFLGFESRQSFYDYGKQEAFSYTINRARLEIECRYEQKLHGNNVAGPIFALKNLGWEDKTETKLSGDLPLSAPQINVFTGDAPPLAGSEDKVDTEQ